MPEKLRVSTVVCTRNSVQDRLIGGFARVDFVELLEMLSESTLDRSTKAAIRDALETDSSHSIDRLAGLLEGVATSIIDRASANGRNVMAANVRRLKDRVSTLLNESDTCPVCLEPMSASGSHIGRILSCCTCIVCEECVPSLSRCPTCRSPRRAAASVTCTSPTERLRDSLQSMSMDEALDAIGRSVMTKSEAVRAIIADIIRPARPNATVLVAIAVPNKPGATDPRASDGASFTTRFIEDLRRELPGAHVTCSKSAMGWTHAGHQAHQLTESHLMQTRFKEFESPTEQSPLQVILVNANSSASEDSIPTAEFTLLLDNVTSSMRSRVLGATLAPRFSDVPSEARAIVVRH